MNEINCKECGHSINKHGTACENFSELYPWDGCQCKTSAQDIAADAVQSAWRLLAEAIVWALGYTDFQEPTPSTYSGQYWWRKELRERSGLTKEQTQQVADGMQSAPAEQEEERQVKMYRNTLEKEAMDKAYKDDESHLCGVNYIDRAEDNMLDNEPVEGAWNGDKYGSLSD